MSLAAFSALLILLLLFPRSPYVVLVLPILVELYVFARVFLQYDDSSAARRIGPRADVRRLQGLGKNLRVIPLLGFIVAGYALSYLNQGTAPSTAVFMVTAAFTLYCLAREGSRWIRVGRVKRQGYVFSDPERRIEVDQAGRERRFYLSWKGQKASLLDPEVPLLYELGELDRQGKIRDLPSLLRRIHALRVGFEKDGWKITPSGQPGVYTMHKGDLSELVTISRRDASWLIRSATNRPHELLLRAQQIATRLKAYKHITRHLKNVTYAGNHSVISTSNGEVFVDLHDGKVYKEDEWSGHDSGFVCIVPQLTYPVGAGNSVIQSSGAERSEYSMEWHDTIILSKIFNISRETFPVRDLLR